MAAAEQHHTLDSPSFDDPVKLLIVVAPYYKDIADQLVAGAQAEIEAAGWSMGVGRSARRAGGANRHCNCASAGQSLTAMWPSAA